MAKVKIQGHASGTGVLTVTAPNTSTDRTITLPDSTGTLLTADGDGSSLTGIATPITALNSATANELVTVGATTTELDAEANLTFDGTNLTLGTGNLIIGTSGKGIDFSATSNSSGTMTGEGLNDYEEGTWTATLSGSSGGTGTWGGPYTGPNSYVKVGNLVTFNAYLTCTSLGDASNAVIIGGLPFTNSTASGYQAVVCGNATGLAISAGNCVTAFVNRNATTIHPRIWNATTGTAAYGFYVSELTADGNLMLSGSYFTT
jgi:hypothetical protein